MAEHEYSYVGHSTLGNALVVAITEAKLHDATTCYELRDEVLAVVRQHGGESVVLDLACVEFMGSIAFLALLALRREYPQGRLVLCNVSPSIHDSLRGCKLVSDDNSAPFEVAPTIEQAVESLGA